MNCVLEALRETTCAAPARARRVAALDARDREHVPRFVERRRAVGERLDGDVTGSSTSYSTSTSAAASRAAWRRLGGDGGEHVADVRRLLADGDELGPVARERALRALARNVGGGDDARRRRDAPRAFVVSIRRTRARGWSEKRIAPCSIPGTTMSPTNGLSPSASSLAQVARAARARRGRSSATGSGSPRRAAAAS